MTLPSRPVGRSLRLPPAQFGIDKAEAPEPAWLRALYDNSNLRITGAYIDGPALDGHPAEEFTSPARATNRRWMNRLTAVARDGWGAVLFYLGYSSGADGSAHRSVHPPPGQPTLERGRLHAQHLKQIVASNIPGWAGAVVMIDNENAESFNLDAPNERALRDYYLAFCDELTRSGPGGAPPMRPGFYLHAPVARPLLRARPDLFVWDVQIDLADSGGSTTTVAPFDLSADRIEVAPQIFIRPAVVTPTPGMLARNDWFAWPAGRQFRFYTGTMPQRNSRVIRVEPTLTPISTFDFDCSLVRNAAFPIAEPRIAAVSGRAEATVLRGSFAEPIRRGVGAHPPMMNLTILGTSVRGTDLLYDPNLPLEPDAPVVAVPPQMPDSIFSVSGDGRVVERRLAAGGWTAWEALEAPASRLRRLRAIASVKRADGTTYLFTITADHRLHAQRRQPGGTWSAPAPMAGDLRLHPFSSVAATLRGPDQAEVLCIDAAGNLANAWWSPLISTWPGDARGVVERTPTLLVGTSLAAIAPDLNWLMGFGIGRDLRLHMAVFRNGGGWLAPQLLGQPADRLTPHARISAQVVSPNLVEVVGVSDDLRVVVHRIRLVGGGWVPDTPVKLPAIPAASATPAAVPDEHAEGWAANPFGDVVVGRTALSRSFVAISALAAAGPRTAAVGRYLDGQQPWWRYR